ncbi:hypothetical protein LZA78_02915 [Sinirhodobacter sp. WL0062]|uniref:Uncharacterized protein n=1 Tax=Rhodobacter flavimaris TaxID=2907145 RepID=A0ABS8YUL9_9RHOB|nr:hypothetical protein [Sinirhodobacter sp. WL0062]MCE5972441.1 hypothetical protein [Sinirhodobacter sp. WL0062]
MIKALRDLFDRRALRVPFEDAAAWLDRNWGRVSALFESKKLARYVFEPVARLWDESYPGDDRQISRLICQVAVANAVIAGLPGRLGVGVLVAIALEIYMAIQIGRRVGLKIDGTSDVAKYFGLGAAIALTILEGFRHVLGFFFSLFALVGFLPATALAELFATSLIGVIFWIGFEEAHEHGSFLIPRRLYKRVIERTKELVKYQYDIVRHGFTLANYKETVKRLWGWLSGEGVYAPRQMRGDIFVPVAFAYMLYGRIEQLSGPLGQTFMQAIRDTNQAMQGLNDQAIADAFREKFTDALGGIDAAALQGMENLVRGRMFELMVEKSVPWEGMGWDQERQTASLHDDFNHPGTDIVFTNHDTGDLLEVQIKAASDIGYIEETLRRYPDYPIIVTSEVGQEFDGLEFVQAANISNADLREVTQENFDSLLEDLPSISFSEMAGAVGQGVAMSLLAQIWPFFAAYMRRRITSDQFTSAIQRLLPEQGARLAKYAVLAAAMGPVYAWWVLARTVMGLVPDPPRQPHKRYIWKPVGGVGNRDLGVEV